MRWGPPNEPSGVPLPSLKAIAVFALIAAAFLYPKLQTTGVAGPTGMGCPNAERSTTNLTETEAREAAMCLLNKTRTQHGLGELLDNAQLIRSAQLHSADMVERRFFAHETPEGVTPAERMMRAGYRGRLMGENLAYGESYESSPARIHDSWMNSPGHRRNILRPEWQEVGIGVVSRIPNGGTPDGATYTTNFGAR